MDAALVGAVCGFMGTAVGAAVGYFGPLQVERRRQQAERNIRAENQTTLDLDRYVRARVVADVWLDLLRRAHLDAVLRRLNLDQFEAEATRHSEELRLRLTELAHLGVTSAGTLDLFGMLRSATHHIMKIESLTGDERHRVILDADELIKGCVAERNAWALSLLDRVSHRTGLELTPPA
ncbi:hypothetical protein ACFYXH_30455 [Streptomyces sp. NPDC002730]|uniref:hypothetical protein n=1 Tax=Streptomyces sp. NPDC002730 TaxID=3364662 RepID=UPI0036BDF0E1